MAYLNGKRILNAKVEIVNDDGGYDEGYAQGKQDGYGQGLWEGHEDGVRDGKEAEWNALWDCIQNGGSMTGNQIGVFSGEYWNDETFKPKYNIVPIAGQYLFQNSKITDLKGILESRGLVLDVSNTGNFYQTFHNSTITHIPALDCSKASSLSATFYNCKNLVSIDEIKWTKENFAWDSTFAYCEELVYVRFKGTIDKSLDLRYNTKLSAESMENIVTTLKRFEETDAEYGNNTLTVSSVAWQRFDDALLLPEVFVISYGSWENYIASIGWNLALM